MGPASTKSQVQKQLSAGQRDNAYLKLAREELSTNDGQQSRKCYYRKYIISMSKSIENAGISIGDGLA